MKAQSLFVQWEMPYIMFVDTVELNYNEQSGSVKLGTLYPMLSNAVARHMGPVIAVYCN